jgi:hypothetical protein
MTELESYGNIELTDENILTKALVELDFGPYKHPLPMTTYQGLWYKAMWKHLDDTIKRFRERRILVISWILAACIGVFGNLFASSLYGRPQYETPGYGVAFLAAAIIAASMLLVYFPPAFQHTFQIFFGREAFDAKLKIFKELQQKRNIELHSNSTFDDKLGDFLRVYNLLLVRDVLRQHPLRTTKVADIRNPQFDFESWVTVKPRSRFAWIKRDIETELWKELGLVCELFATTIVPIGPGWIDENTADERIRKFDSALLSIDFDKLKDRVVGQITGTLGN